MSTVYLQRRFLMLIRAYSVFLLYCLLITASAGCTSKTEVTQQSNTAQQTTTTHPPAPAAPAAKGNTQTEQQQQQNVNAAAGSANSKTDACSLLTSDEIKEVQGEAIKETKPSDRTNGSFTISQCLYSLPTYNKSVSLQVTRSSAKDKPDEAREFWERTFHKEGEEAREKRSEERRVGQDGRSR